MCSAGLASAAPVSFFDADWTASGSIPASSKSLAKKGTFLDTLQAGYMSEGFSNLGLSPFTQDPFAVTRWGGNPRGLWNTGSLTPSDFTDLNAVLTASKTDKNKVNQGRFDTTGADATGSPSWWFESDKSFTVAFGGAFSAFGFYITDATDWGGTLAMRLTAEDGSTSTLDVMNSGNTPGGGASNGGLAFFGFTDQARKYTSVQFVLAQATGSNPASPDIFGFDDLIVGDVNLQQTQVVPEPTSLALAGLALLGVVASRRKISA
jgi:hypothetical protein